MMKREPYSESLKRFYFYGKSSEKKMPFTFGKLREQILSLQGQEFMMTIPFGGVYDGK